MASATFEVTSKPWFGPKARAKEILAAHRVGVVRPGPAALNSMEAVFGDLFGAVQHVRFVDFRMNGQFRYTIAVCWTDSNDRVRDALYRQAPECVAACGWYPLPQGERLHSPEAARVLPPSSDLPLVSDAIMASIAAAANGSDTGTAIRLTMTDGSSLLLDSGFGREDLSADTDRIVLISHHHRDHIGGLEEGRLAGLPVAMPAAAGVDLLAQRRLKAIAGANPITWLEPGTVYRLGEQLTVTPVVVPHMPGSVGYVLDDGARSLTYTGDIVLKSSRHDAMPDLLAAIPHGRESTVLLDGTMAGREEGASQATPATWVAEESTRRDVVVLAHHDHLLYAYLDVFHTVTSGTARNRVNFAVTERVKPLFQVLHDAFIRRRLDSLDPLLSGQYGKSMSAWGESRWLYWLKTGDPRPEGHTVWFLTPEEYGHAAVRPGSAILTVGRVDLLDGLKDEGVDTTPWTGHSDQAALADGIRTLESEGHRVVLFHNFTKRIAKFCRLHGLAATALGSLPQALSRAHAT
ncbi:Beta-lactamase superfamily domain-containing protein [Micromonospora viridifaciens]|uniref:Beta-lactamase superfamily domain-containing protein n=1 Tax=Micromonospora viridifaciens TaxID=1881 RepID=A0A1C4Y8C3_MICVI|nr:MBL fold metallo-hydrolase [Micromonospora viridifaciens]SCF16581.1 Beta-lactamase superfamily domain-containing protein [Micromonospora viridifaciens]